MRTVIWPLLALIAAAGLIIWLQIWLSSRKSFLPGLLLIVPTCVALLALSVWAFYTNAGYHDVLFSENLKNGITGEVTIRLDREDQVVAATNLQIRDKDGNLLEEVGIDEGRYQQIWAKVTDQYDINDGTAPIFESDLKIKNGVYIFHGGTVVSETSFLGAIAIVDLPLLAIYLLKRFRIRRKKRMDELRKVNIESL